MSGGLEPMDFNADHFALFGMSPAFRVDATMLDKRFLEMQARVHPDRFAAAGEKERRLSLQWATRVNEAYQTLRNPLARARYLLELSGQAIDQESNSAMSPEFLMEQMEWREAVAEARQGKQVSELEQLHQRVKQDMGKRYEQLAGLLDDRRDSATAADRVRRLMFLEKLLAEIDDGLAVLEG